MGSEMCIRDRSGTHPEAVALANLIAQNIEHLDQDACERLMTRLREELANRQG